jgi:thioredoxin 1
MKYNIQKIVLSLAVISLAACTSTQTDSESTDTPTEIVSPVAEITGTHEDIDLAKFTSIINEDKVTMVDFYAVWCGPCKAMAPDVLRLKKDYEGKANVLKIDAEDKLDIAQQFQLQGYPTTIFFKKGKVVANELGYRNYDQLKAIIDRHMAI